MRGVALVALVSVLAVPAGVDAATLAHRTGVLHGVVTRGPACTPGNPLPCIPPVAGVKILFLRLGHLAAQTTTASNGTYRIRLRAGRYAIQLPGRGNWRPGHALVRRGQVTRIDIAFDVPTG